MIAEPADLAAPPIAEPALLAALPTAAFAFIPTVGFFFLRAAVASLALAILGAACQHRNWLLFLGRSLTLTLIDLGPGSEFAPGASGYPVDWSTA